jgi:hypothetical protein
MIHTEHYMTRADGVELTLTWSDKDMMIERDGARYAEAIDPTHLGRVYTETDEPVDVIEMEPQWPELGEE